MISSIGLTIPPNFEGLLLTLHATLFQMVFCFAFLGNDIFISDQKVKAKAIEIVLLYCLGNPKGRTSAGCFFYASHITSLLPLQTDTYIDDSVEIFLKLSMKNSTSACNYWDDFNYCFG